MLAEQGWAAADGPGALAELVGGAGQAYGLVERWVFEFGPEVSCVEMLGLGDLADGVDGLEGDVVVAEELDQFGFGALGHPGVPECIQLFRVLEGEPAILEAFVVLPVGVADEFHETVPLAVDHGDDFVVAVFDGGDLPGIEGVHVCAGAWSRLAGEDIGGDAGAGHDVGDDVDDGQPRVLSLSVLACGASSEEGGDGGVQSALELGCVVGQAEGRAVGVADAVGDAGGEGSDQGFGLPVLALDADAEDGD